jgi:hypothetical protein
MFISAVIAFLYFFYANDFYFNLVVKNHPVTANPQSLFRLSLQLLDISRAIRIYF